MDDAGGDVIDGGEDGGVDAAAGEGDGDVDDGGEDGDVNLGGGGEWLFSTFCRLYASWACWAS